MNDNGIVIYSSNFEYILNLVANYTKHYFYTDILIIKGQENFPLEHFISSLFDRNKITTVGFKKYGQPSIQEKINSFNKETLLVIVTDLYTMLGDRLDSRLDQIQFRLHPKTKIVVEPFPYYVKPWQIYFPYSLLNKNWLQYNHSYAIEGEWNKYKEGIRKTNPCDENLVVQAVKHCTFIDYQKYFVLPKVQVIETSNEVKQKYEIYKNELFNSENTPKSLLHKLNKYVQDLCPSRSIPYDLKKIYKPDFKEVTKTDLKIDNYLLAEMHELINHTNNLTTGFYREQPTYV